MFNFRAAFYTPKGVVTSYPKLFQPSSSFISSLPFGNPFPRQATPDVTHRIHRPSDMPGPYDTKEETPHHLVEARLRCPNGESESSFKMEVYPCIPPKIRWMEHHVYPFPRIIFYDFSRFGKKSEGTKSETTGNQGWFTCPLGGVPSGCHDAWEMSRPTLVIHLFWA